MCYRCLLAYCLHSKAAELCLANSWNNSITTIYKICGWICEKGLPHTSNFLSFKDHNLMFKYSTIETWNLHHVLCYVSILNSRICRSIPFNNLNLWIVEACKSDVCGTPLFANLVTYIEYIYSIQHVSTACVTHFITWCWVKFYCDVIAEAITVYQHFDKHLV